MSEYNLLPTPPLEGLQRENAALTRENKKLKAELDTLNDNIRNLMHKMEDDFK